MRRHGCPSDEELSDFNLGDLSESSLDEVARHLESCPRCEARAQRLDSQTDEILVALRRTASGVGPAADRKQNPRRSGGGGVADSGPARPLTGGGVSRSRPKPSAEDRLVPKKDVEAESTSGGPPVLEDFRLDGYEIGDALGRGGMGLVYRARQVALNRPVALKIIRGDPARLVSRFQIEAEAVARLQHPNIVQIYEVGWKDGRPYLALEFIDGGSLEEKLAGRPQPAREAAELVRTLAVAVDYAHRRGIIHRDLKPSNILLTDGGVPKIADFGVAKRLELNDHETREGDLIGTPCYMAPEQASGEGEHVGPATDVYSLGVILYEALTGRAPLQAPTAIETLILVNVQEPVPPRRLQPRIPVDLERITLKCLEKEPGRRYACALDLADDLGRFLNNEPILARQVPWFERAWRWARRRPALASALGAAAIGLVAAILAGWQYNVMLRRFNSDLQAAAAHAQTNANRAEEAKREALNYAKSEAVQREQAEKTLYFSHIALAESEWRNNNVAGADLLLEKCVPGPGRHDYRGWEWSYLKGLSHPELLTLRGCRQWVHSLAYSPDGRRIVAGAGLPFNLPGTNPSITPGDLRIWDSATGQLIAAPEKHAGAIWAVDYSADGRRIASASADGVVRVWDAQTCQTIAKLSGPEVSNVSIKFSPVGSLMAIADSRSLRLWDWKTQEIKLESTHFRGNCPMAFTADGTRLVAGHESNVVELLDIKTGAIVRSFKAEFGQIRGVTYSPDGSILAGATEVGPVVVWDAETGQERLQLRGHGGESTCVAFSPDGARLVSGSVDQTVRVWDLKTGFEVLNLRGHTFGVRSVAYQSDGTRIASGSQDGTVKVWDANRDPRGLRIRKGDNGGEWTGRLSFTPDGERIVVVRHDLGLLQSYDATSGKSLSQKSIRIDNQYRCPRGDTTLDEECRRLAGPLRDDPKQIIVWETSTGRQLQTLQGHTTRVVSAAFAPDGRRLASAARGAAGSGELGESILWDVASGTPLRTWPGKASSAVVRHAFSSRGERFASGHDDGTIQVWDTETGALLLTLVGHRGSITDIAFSFDGYHLATVAREDPTLRVWDLSDGAEILTLRGDKHPLTSVAFSPDDRRLVSVGYEGSVKLWDATTGQEILSLRGVVSQRPGDYYFNARAVFSPDNSRIVSNMWDGGLVVWGGTEPNPR